ncbi:MAG: hypothetical protein NDI90_18960 [Nitrospira sp. BO4]|nr:hypothetical protein [Nitrospira sp. BO4]
MTLLIVGKSDVIPPMAMKVALSLCMTTMIAGCSSGRDSSSRPVAPGGGSVGQAEAPSNDPLCLTDEQKLVKVKELGWDLFLVLVMLVNMPTWLMM